MNRDFLKEAIADAKTVKESAIANAKVALEEAFSPQLQAMFAQKLEEMDKEEMEEGYDEVDEAEKVDEKMSDPVMRKGLKGDNTAEKETEEMREEDDMSLDEILAELEKDELQEDARTDAEEEGYLDGMKDEKEDLKEDERTDAEEEGYLDGMKDEKEDMEDEDDEDIDLEDMSEEDLKSFIEDVIADMVKAGELEAGDAVEDEDVEVEDEDVEVEDMEMDSMEVEIEEDEYIEEAKEVNGKKSMDEGLLDFLKKKKKEAPKAEDSPKLVGVDFDGNYIYSDDPNLSKKSYAELNEAIETIAVLKSELNEINLLNAKLLYANKIFKAKNMNESQKAKVLGAFDKAETVKEVKIVFETLNENFKPTKKSSHEGVMGSASKATLAPKTTKKPIVESNEMVNRFKKLAGII